MTTVVERGDVFFFYRPRIDAGEIGGLDDVQRFFFILEPDGTRRFREIIVGRKRLPSPDAHERAWAFVFEVADRPEEVRDDLERKAYETRTRGRRVQPEARPVGEGRYVVALHDDHSHLAYELELPPEPGPAQRLFNIERQASFVVAVRNPAASAPPGAGLPPHQRPELPPELRARFGDRRFIAVATPELLDVERIELVLIGAARDAERELGIEIDARDEDLAHADLFEKLRVRPDELPVEPLERGELR